MKKLKLATFLLALCAVGSFAAGCNLLPGSDPSSEELENSSSAEENENSSSTEENENSSSGGEVVEPPVDTSNTVVAFDIQNFWNTDGGLKLSFMTNEAFSGITEISFDAMTGETTSWWGLAITKDNTNASAYNVDLSLGKEATNGQWVNYKYTFSETGCVITSSLGYYKEVTEYKEDAWNATDAFYVYFVGARGETFSDKVYVDNFKLVADGETFTEDFEGKSDTWMFGVKDARATAIVDVEYELYDANSVAVLDIQSFWNTDGKEKNSLYTLEEFTGITKVSFDVKTGETVSWWGLAIADDIATAASSYNIDLANSWSTNGKWATITYEFSESGCVISTTLGQSKTVTEYKEDAWKADGSFYLYIVGARGETFSEKIMIDNFTIVAGEETYTEDFEGDMNEWMFNVNDTRAVASEIEEYELYDANSVAVLDIQSFWNTDGKEKNSLYTLEEFTGITKVSFDVKTGETVSWWGLAIADDIATAASSYNIDLANSWSTNGKWATITYEFSESGCVISTTLGQSKTVTEYKEDAWKADGSFYLYIVGARGETFSEKIMIDNFTIVAGGETYTENFEGNVDQWMFNVNDARAVASGIEEYEIYDMNNVVKIDVKNFLSPDDGKMSFITGEAFSGITQISFDAKTGEGAAWWGIGMITDTAEASIYNHKLGTLPSTNGQWATFTYTFADGKVTVTSTLAGFTTYEKEFVIGEDSFYVYFLGERGGSAWTDSVYVDNFTIVADGETHTDTFEAGADGNMFAKIADARAVSSMLEDYTIAASDENEAA